MYVLKQLGDALFLAETSRKDRWVNVNWGFHYIENFVSPNETKNLKLAFFLADDVTPCLGKEGEWKYKLTRARPCSIETAFKSLPEAQPYPELVK